MHHDPNPGGPGQSGRQVQVLRELGLSRAEAEVYLACLGLAAAGGGALSSYRVAQDMGRDPANVGKIVNALVRLQAVRVVQEKPRLFAAVPPEEFTERLLGRLRQSGAEAVSLLESLGAPVADGVAQALTGRSQAIARICELLATCRRDALILGSPEALRELGADLERAAERPGCRVRVVSPTAFTSAVVEIAVLPTAGRLGLDPREDWVALAVDDQAWLVVLIPQESSGSSVPCGWWSDGSPLARVLADCLETCWRYGMPVKAAAGGPAPEPAADVPASAPEAAPPTEPVFASFADESAGVQTPPAATPEAEPLETTVRKAMAALAGAATEPATTPLTADQAEQEGFTFLFKHEPRRRPGER